ncbi:MAG: hypothetical protein A2Z29_02170 [Chloroflexi bacterium RBG_16_56_11]|nr:MAG: hypothetical protein A2Z29_02170 [Chloroflexi bacterium RBG_16_56_11]
MLKKILTVILLSTVAMAAVACSGKASAAQVKARWIEPATSGDTVSLSVNDIVKSRIVHFRLNSVTGRPAFMAYQFNDEIIVRSNICPPCRSVGFSLKGSELVCDTCGTRFLAASGEGIAGPCVAYPKASVTYNNTGDQIVLTQDNLIKAYQDTLEPGLN